MDSPFEYDLDCEETRMFLDNPPLGIYEAKDHQQHQQQLTFQPLSLGGGGQEIVEYSSSPSESSSPGSRDLSYSASHTRNSSISLSSDRKEDVHKDMSYVEQFVEDMLTIDHLMDIPSSPLDSSNHSNLPVTPPSEEKSTAPEVPSSTQFSFTPSPTPSNAQVPKYPVSALESEHTWADASFPVNPTGHPVPRDDSPILDIEITPRKSRVETQMTLFMKYENFPKNIKNVRFPEYTVSKPKHMAGAVITEETLQIHTMLVSATAMRKPDLVCRAFERAREKALSPPKPELIKKPEDDFQSRLEKKLLPSSNKRKYPINGDPMEGGEVIICGACMAREERRAARKKAKPEAFDSVWKGHAQHRIVIVNSNCMREVKDVEDSSSSTKFCDAQIRIACYCRHHGEKEGFRIIFTVLDHDNTIITQTMSPSLMITDDHKTQNASPAQETARKERPSLAAKMAELKPKRPYTRRVKPPTNGVATNGTATPSSASTSVHGLVSSATSLVNGANSLNANAITTPLFAGNGMAVNGINGTSTSSTQEPSAKRRRASPNPSFPSTKESSPALSTNVSTPVPVREMTPPSMPTPSQMNSPLDFQPTFHFNDAMIPSPYDENAAISSTSSQMGQLDTDMDAYSIPLGEPFSIDDHLILENPLTTVDDRNALLPGPPSMELPTPPQTEEFTVIHSLIPNHGSCAGGESVTVLGNLLEQDMVVCFGKAASLTQYWNSGCLVCTVPPSPTPGPVIVSLRRKNGDEVRMRTEALQIFTYVERVSQEVMELALRLMKHAGKDTTINGFIQATLDSQTNNSNIWDPSSTSGMNLRQAAAAGDNESLEELLIDGFKKCDKMILAKHFHATLKGTRHLTLLHYCAMLDMPKLAEFILNICSRTTYVDANGNTALDTAYIFGKPATAAVLRAAESESASRVISRRGSVSTSGSITPSSRRESVRLDHGQLAAALSVAQQSLGHLDSILNGVSERAPSRAEPRECRECGSPGECNNYRTPMGRNNIDEIESLKERLEQLERSMKTAKRQEKDEPSTKEDQPPSYSSGKAIEGEASLRKRPQVSWKEQEAQSSSEAKGSEEKAIDSPRQFWKLPNVQEAFLTAVQGTMQGNQVGAEERNNQLKEYWLHWFKGQAEKNSAPVNQETIRETLEPVTQTFATALMEHLSTSLQNFQQGLPAMPAMPAMPGMPGNPVARFVQTVNRAQTPVAAEQVSLSKLLQENYSWRELFSSPPAYDEIFPGTNSASGEKERFVEASSSSTILLQDEPLPEPVQRYLAAKGRQTLTEDEKEVLRVHAMKIKRIRSDRRLYFVWIPLLIFTFIAMSYSWGPKVASAFGTVYRQGQHWLGNNERIVEL